MACHLLMWLNIISEMDANRQLIENSSVCFQIENCGFGCLNILVPLSVLTRTKGEGRDIKLVGDPQAHELLQQTRSQPSNSDHFLSQAKDLLGASLNSKNLETEKLTDEEQDQLNTFSQAYLMC